MSALAGLSARLEQRVAPRPLALARIIAGVNALILSVEALVKLSLIVQPDVLRLPYIPGMPTLPGGLLLPLIALWITMAVTFTIGWQTRLSGGMLAVVMGYSFLFDQQAYSNHVYLMTLLVMLLALSDCGAALSVDARRSPRREEPVAWPVLLMKCQLSIVYGFAALSKLNSEYLSGAMIEANLRTSGPLAIPEAWHGTAMMGVIAASSIAAELFLAFAFWSPRWRKLAVISGFGFHAGILLTMHTGELLGLLGFALCMFAVYPLFCDMSRLWGWLDRRSRTTAGEVTPAAPTPDTPLAG